MAVMGYRAAVSYTPTRLPVPFDVQGDLQPYPANHSETMRLPVLSDECAAVCPHNEVYRSAAHKRGITDLVIDSTGLKVFGKGEWKVRKHGAEKGCVWRKLYLAVDLATHEVVAAVRIPVKLNSDSGICEHHFRKVCGQGFCEQKLSFEGRHLFDSPNKPAAKRSAAVVDPGHWSMTVHLTSEFVL